MKNLVLNTAKWALNNQAEIIILEVIMYIILNVGVFLIFGLIPACISLTLTVLYFVFVSSKLSKLIGK